MLGKLYKPLNPADHEELMRQVREERGYYLKHKENFEICLFGSGHALLTKGEQNES